MHSRGATGLALLGALALPPPGAHAEEVALCYNYGCYVRAPVTYSVARLAPLGELLAAADDATAERSAISVVIGRMYAIAGEQTPVWRDKGGNYADGGEPGKMDCIDHSTTTTAFLRMLQARGWLRLHEVLEPLLRRRFLIAEHRAARVRERETQRVYVVDSWYYDNGHPALVMPVEDWLGGKAPNVW